VSSGAMWTPRARGYCPSPQPQKIALSIEDDHRVPAMVEDANVVVVDQREDEVSRELSPSSILSKNYTADYLIARGGNDLRSRLAGQELPSGQLEISALASSRSERSARDQLRRRTVLQPPPRRGAFTLRGPMVRIRLSPAERLARISHTDWKIEG
jgi:hypothetical protein